MSWAELAAGAPGLARLGGPRRALQSRVVEAGDTRARGENVVERAYP